MNFRKFIEAVATIGSAPPPTMFHDEGEGDDDDDGWDWRSIFEKYGLVFAKWCMNSPTIKKIKPITDYYVYNEAEDDKPNNEKIFINVVEAQGGSGTYDVQWTMDEQHPNQEKIEEDIKPILLTSDLWRYLGIDSKDAYAVLDKGDFLEFAVYHILQFIYYYLRTKDKEGAARLYRYAKNTRVDQRMIQEFSQRYQQKFGKVPQVTATLKSTSTANYVKDWLIHVQGTQHYEFRV